MDDKKDQDANAPEDQAVNPSDEVQKQDDNQAAEEQSTTEEPGDKPSSEENVSPTAETEEPDATEDVKPTDEENPTEQPLQSADSKPDETSYEELKSSLEEQPGDQPDSTGAADSDPNAPMTTGSVVTATSKRSLGGRWFKIVLPLILLLLLLAAATYVFAFYLPNRPSSVYNSSLSSTADALDELVAYAEKQQTVEHNSVKYTGSIKYSSGIVAEADLNGVVGKNGNGKMELNVKAAGQKFNGELIFNKQKDNKTPDFYLKARGIKQLLQGSDLAKLDGQWIVIDHTFIESMQNQLESTVGVDQSTQTGVNPTMAQINDAVAKLQNVNRKYIFTTDSQYAVLKDQKFVGEETANERAVYHYKVGYDKQNLKTYLEATGKALDSSQLNDWAKQNYSKNISETLNVKKLKSDVDKADANYRFDMWVDKQTKLVQSVKFNDFNDDDGAYFAISQNYTGGDAFPVSLDIGGNNADGSSGLASFTATINTATNGIGFEVSADNLGSKGANLNGKFDLAPSDEEVKVTVPKKATSINKVMQQIPLFSLLSS